MATLNPKECHVAIAKVPLFIRITGKYRNWVSQTLFFFSFFHSFSQPSGLKKAKRKKERKKERNEKKRKEKKERKVQRKKEKKRLFSCWLSSY